MTATDPLFLQLSSFHNFHCDLECLISLLSGGQLVEPHLHPRLGLLFVSLCPRLSKTSRLCCASIFCLTVYFFNSFSQSPKSNLNAAKIQLTRRFLHCFLQPFAQFKFPEHSFKKSLDWLVILHQINYFSLCQFFCLASQLLRISLINPGT